MDSVISKVSLCINDNCWMNRLSISLIIAFSIWVYINARDSYDHSKSFICACPFIFKGKDRSICWWLKFNLLGFSPQDVFIATWNCFYSKIQICSSIFFLIIDVLKKSTWLSFIKHFFNDISLSIFISQCLSTIFFNFFIWENTVNRSFKIDTSFLLQRYQ